MLSILQRDARLIDFLMEDIAGYSDDQVGAAVRSLHEQSRAALGATSPWLPSSMASKARRRESNRAIPALSSYSAMCRPSGKATQGILRHKGWRVEKVDLPKLQPKEVTVLAPAEIEIE